MRMNVMIWVARKVKLDWVVVNRRFHSGNCKIVVAPYYDGEIPMEDILKKEIPFWFLACMKLLHPKTKVVVKSLITKDDIRLETIRFKLANAT